MGSSASGQGVADIFLPVGVGWIGMGKFILTASVCFWMEYFCTGRGRG